MKNETTQWVVTDR